MRSLLNKSAAKRGTGWRVLIASIGMLLLPACDVESIVELTNPDLITPEVVADTANLPTVANGVIYEFARAFGGEASNANTAGPGVIHLSGLLADEFWHASTFNSLDEIDARDILDENGELLIAYRYLQRARNLAERTAELFAESPRANSALHAEMINLAGFAYVLFAETFCSGVPFSNTQFDGELEYGEQLTTTQTLERALAHFDAALAMANAAGAEDMVSLARVGRGRALQNLGRFDEAAAAVAGVPDDFLYELPFGPPPQPNNAVWYFTNSASRISAATNEGVNGLAFFARGGGENTTDPRTPADSSGFGLGNPNTPLYSQGLYPSQESPLPLASGIEARLIEAEAALDGGASSAYLTTLNDLREGAELDPLADPGSADARVEQFYGERARWLWLTSHRLGDLRRMIRNYGFEAGEVFPIGNAIQGEAYGDDTSLPIPFDERNNPNFTGGCLATE
jgi:starch-binding outer membrane protein, SusD/RagB family